MGVEVQELQLIDGKIKVRMGLVLGLEQLLFPLEHKIFATTPRTVIANDHNDMYRCDCVSLHHHQHQDLWKVTTATPNSQRSEVGEW